MPELRVEGAVFKSRLSYSDCGYVISELEGGQGPASQRGKLFSRWSLDGPRAAPYISHNSLTAFATAGYDERQW